MVTDANALTVREIAGSDEAALQPKLQASVDVVTPSADSRSPHGSDALHPRYPNHRVDGTTAPHNALAVTHGGRRRRPVLAEQTSLYASWAADLGGVDELATGQRELLRRAVDNVGIADSAVAYLRSSKGSLTSARTLAAISVLHSATDRVIRIATALGLERRAKPVETLESYLDAREAKA